MNPCQAISQAVTNGIEYSAGAVKDATISTINLTARVTKDVGGMRSVASSVAAVIDAIDLSGTPVEGLKPLRNTCKTFNAGMAGVNVIQRAGKLLDGSTNWENLVQLIGRIVFLVYDFLTSLEWLESMALVAKGTASNITFAVFGTSSQSILPTMSFVGYAMEFTDNAYSFVNDGPNWTNGLKMGTNAAKMVGIALTGVAGPVAQWGKIAATVTATVIVFVENARR